MDEQNITKENENENENEAETKAEKPEKKPSSKKKTSLKDEVKKLNQRLEEAEEAHNQLIETHQRVLAEYANYKRRTTEEKEQIGEFTTAEVLKALIPAIDSLDHAILAAEELDTQVKEGIQLTFRKVIEITESLGLEPISPLNQEFNPEEHNCVLREDAEDSQGTEIVTEVFGKGYKFKNRILRPAMVKVRN